MEDQPTDLKAESDLNLVILLQVEARASPQWNTAATELFRRYRKGLYAHCKKVHGHRCPSQAALLDLIHDAFMGFVNAIDRFNPNRAKAEVEIPTLIRCWLAKQASWIVNSAKPDAPEDLVAAENTLATGLDEMVIEGANAIMRKHRPSREHLTNMRKMRKLLHRLSERSRDVLKTSYRYRDHGTGVCNVPIEIQVALCSKWGFSNRNSLLKFRQRQFAKLTELMTSQSDVA